MRTRTRSYARLEGSAVGRPDVLLQRSSGPKRRCPDPFVVTSSGTVAGAADGAGIETRIAAFDFSFSDGADQVLLEGTAVYPTRSSTLRQAATVVRPAIGGSGACARARGWAVSRPNADNTWTHVFRLQPQARTGAGSASRPAGIVGSMGLGFGLLSAQLRPGETGWTRAYDETIRLAVDAERLGFASVWTTEHHFVDDGYMPSLLVVSAAIAQATSRIEIGTGVVLAPMHHPLRLAEDAATVQLLSHGRLVLGLGLGWSGVEFAGLGADPRRRGAAMDEILEILPQAWSGEPFTHHGAVYDLPELAVRPTPPSRIPILIGGGAERAIRRAARLADGIFASVPAAEFAQQVRWVLDECERVGRDPSTFRFVHYSVLLPGATREGALSQYAEALWAMQWKYSDMEASATRPLPAAVPPVRNRPLEDLVTGRATYAGPPDDLVEALLAIRAQAGVPVELVARSHFPLLEYGEQLELMHHLADGVASRV